MQRLINWFEIPVSDLTRAKAFYEETFQVTLRIEDMGDMQLAVFPYAEPATGGALMACPEGRPGEHGVVIYLDGGADLAQPLARAVAAGGRVLMPKTAISPEIGHIALFADSEGNRIGLHSLG
ncbi:MAG: VOC family protein [Zoogloea sp.]|nr:VOC family protein [Zoogloea sp.]MCA0186826.1 VOC family protein [Pseudomonadota bacterium]